MLRRLLIRESILPGFTLSMGITLAYLFSLVVLPLCFLIYSVLQLDSDVVLKVLSSKRLFSAVWVTVSTALIASLLNMVIGLLVAWVLVRYRFWGRKILDACVDIPFALPTAVAGIALTTLYAPNGWIGQFFAAHDIRIAYSQAGIVLALTFIGLPFVVRTLEPVLEDMDAELEEAASCLGASRLQVFSRVLFPHILPALITGFAMAFARALGEYGSVIFIAGNMPFRTEVVSLLITVKLEQYDLAGASVIAVMMLLLSFVMLFFINSLQHMIQVKR
jgi:sulfate/thiosulfate transport system permease protein